MLTKTKNDVIIINMFPAQSPQPVRAREAGARLRVFLASLATESNTFLERPTTLADFTAFELFHGDATAHTERAIYGRVLAAWRRRCERQGHRVFEGLCAAAESGGRVEMQTWHSLRDELLADLKAAAPLDVVLLNLHGAMVADGCDDCEGDLLRRVREIVGPRAFIAVLLDLHCHLTPAMLEIADVLVAYKEYPHTDVLERADEVLAIALDCIAAGARPAMAAFDCRMIGSWPTSDGPMRGFVDRMRQAERVAGVLSVSLAHGYPWADVADVGAKTWVVARDRALAQSKARELGWEFYSMRADIADDACSIEAALALGRSDRGPMIWADVADNPGGGAPGDATFILRALLESKTRDVVVGCLVDATAVARCLVAGEGARVRLNVGGYSGARSGGPVTIDGTVRAVKEQHWQTGLLGEPESLGASAWLEQDGCAIVLCSLRTQTYHPDAFTALGLDLAKRAIVVVKSACHFRVGFAPLASRIVLVQTDGALPAVGSIRYSKRDAIYWPRRPDPLTEKHPREVYR